MLKPDQEGQGLVTRGGYRELRRGGTAKGGPGMGGGGWGLAEGGT